MMIKCKTIGLRVAEIEDRRKIFEWLTQSDITLSMMGKPNYPDHLVPSWENFQQDYTEAFFDENADEKGRNYIILLAETEIGTIGYDSLDRQTGTVDLDIWMKEEKYCGHGYGTEALTCLIGYLHEKYGITIFRVDPSARNERAIRAYKKAGFRVEPDRVWNRRPDYEDAISMKLEMAPNKATMHTDGPSARR